MSDFSAWLQELKSRGISISYEEEKWLKDYFIAEYKEKHAHGQIAKQANIQRLSLLAEQRLQLLGGTEELSLSLQPFGTVWDYFEARNYCATQRRLYKEWVSIERAMRQAKLSSPSYEAPFSQEMLNEAREKLQTHQKYVEKCTLLYERGIRVGLEMPEITSLMQDKTGIIYDLEIEVSDRESLWRHWDSLERWYQSTFDQIVPVSLETRLSYLKKRREEQQNYISRQHQLWAEFSSRQNMLPSWVYTEISLPLTEKGIKAIEEELSFDSRWRKEWNKVLSDLKPNYRAEIQIPSTATMLTQKAVIEINSQIKKTRIKKQKHTIIQSIAVVLIVPLVFGGYFIFEKNQQYILSKRILSIQEKATTIGWELELSGPPYDQSEIEKYENDVSSSIKLHPRVVSLRTKGKEIDWKMNVSGPPYDQSEIERYENEYESLLPFIEQGMMYLEAQKAKTRKDIQELYSVKPIPSGTFMMGCIKGDNDCDRDERPSHQVRISRSFVMMKSEVTQALYNRVMKRNPSMFSGANRSVEGVSWFDAVNFANRLSEIEGLETCYSIDGENVRWNEFSCVGWRLPTEAEWEYAARGGKSYKYAGSNTAGVVAWYDGDQSTGSTHVVCGKQTNGYGLCDMSGNLWEWVWDWKGKYDSSLSVDPRGPTSGSYRVVRSGGWNREVQAVRLSNRDYDKPTKTYGNLGFRLLRASP